MKRISLVSLLTVLLLIFVSHNIAFAIEVIVDADFTGEIQYLDGFRLDLDLEATVTGNWSYFQIIAGKKQNIWGTGHTDTLGLSKTSPTIPQIGYRIEYLRSNYTHLLFPLERSENRWLFAHRIETNIIPRARIGIWETMMCSGSVYPGYFVPIPLIPFYAIQHVAYKTSGSIYDMNSNVMFGLDFSYQVDSDWELYGEIVVDDFPQRRIYGNPRKIGGLLGFQWNGWKEKDFVLWLEYVRLNNFVYTHKNPGTRYLYQGEHFGHWLGMDGDLLAVGVEKSLSKKDDLGGQFHFIRKGEGDYEDNWQGEFEDDLEFLSGVIEQRAGLNLTWIHHVSPDFSTTLETQLSKRWNANHQPGTEEISLAFLIQFKYTFDTAGVF